MGSCIKTSIRMLPIRPVFMFLLVRKVTGDCGYAGDCSAGDGDYTCPGDCQLFVTCSNGVPTIMSCAAGTFFDESLDLCVWNCPWSDTITTTTTTTIITTTTDTTTTTSLPENCV